MADEPFALHIGNHLELLLTGDLAVDAVKLPEVDPFHP